MLLSTMPIDVDSDHLSANNSTIMPSSSPVRIQITSPTYIMSADEVVTFSAKLYDSVNSEVAGNIIWSSTNGTITDEGTVTLTAKLLKNTNNRFMMELLFKEL